LKEKSEQEDFDVAEMQVGNLGVDEVNCVIMDLLSLDDSSKTIALAELCLKRTAGNVFFSITFIAMPQEEGLLVFDLGLFQWKWDVMKMESDRAQLASMSRGCHSLGLFKCRQVRENGC
jgi:predicted ATPase